MRKLSLLFFLMMGVCLYAQKTTPDNVYQIDGAVETMQLTEAGVLLAIGSNGITGILPSQSKPIFVFNDYGKVKAESVEYVPNSPYIIVSKDAKILTGATKRAVVDVVSGQVLFDTDSRGWHAINSAEVFLPENKLLVSGTKSEKPKGAPVKVNVPAVGLYDLATGEEVGFAYLEPKFRETGKISSSSLALSGTPAWVKTKIFTPTTKGVVCVDLESGNVVWESKTKNLTKMVADESGNEIYGFEEKNNNTRIHKFGAQDGAELWAKERKIKGVISQFSILPQGIAVVGDLVKSGGSSLVGRVVGDKAESYISFLDAASGEDLWEKAPKTKGIVQHFYIQDDGILFGMFQGGVNKISFDGKTLFKSPLKTGENIQVMASTPQGVIYITDTDAGVFNDKTGESILSKPIKYKKAAAVAATYDEVNKRYLISTGNELISVDETNGDISTLASYKLDEGEAPSTISMRDDGIFLGSSQNVLLLDFDGNEKFHKYFKSPGRGLGMKILMGTLGVVATVGATAAAVHAGDMHTFGSQTDWQKKNQAQSEALSDIGSASFSDMATRYKASASTNNSQFILTNLSDGVGLVKVNKDTGEIDNEIVLKDKKPQYEVDELGGYLFYKSGGKEISAFKL